MMKYFLYMVYQQQEEMMESQSNQSVESYSGLLQDIRTIINQGRALAYAADSTVSVDTYWIICLRVV